MVTNGPKNHVHRPCDGLTSHTHCQWICALSAHTHTHTHTHTHSARDRPAKKRCSVHEPENSLRLLTGNMPGSLRLLTGNMPGSLRLLTGNMPGPIKSQNSLVRAPSGLYTERGQRNLRAHLDEDVSGGGQRVGVREVCVRLRQPHLTHLHERLKCEGKTTILLQLATRG